MSDHNVLAWDFAKLETELKVRLLPVVLRDDQAFHWLLKRGQLRPTPEVPKDGPPAVGVPPRPHGGLTDWPRSWRSRNCSMT